MKQLLPRLRPAPFPRLRLLSPGFTLVELMVVMGVILVLMTLLIPSMKSISGSTNLTSVTEEFAAKVNLARQRASTFNRQVAIRFWKQGASGPYRSYQLWEQVDSADPASWQPVERIRVLPNDVVITENTSYSTLLGRFPLATHTDGRRYTEALFTPAGSLVASSTQTAVTFIPDPKPAATGSISGLPPNFGVVSIQPMNAIPTIYRPQ